VSEKVSRLVRRLWSDSNDGIYRSGTRSCTITHTQAHMSKDAWCASSSPSSASSDDDATVEESSSRDLEAVKRRLLKLGFKRGFQGSETTNGPEMKAAFEKGYSNGLKDGIDSGRLEGALRVAGIVGVDVQDRAKEASASEQFDHVLRRVRGSDDVSEMSENRTKVARGSASTKTVADPQADLLRTTTFGGALSETQQYQCRILHLKGSAFVWIGGALDDPQLGHLCLGVKLPFQDGTSVATTFFGSSGESIGDRIAKKIALLSGQQCYVSYNIKSSRLKPDAERSLVLRVVSELGRDEAR